MDGLTSSELDEVGYTDLFLLREVPQIPAYALETRVLGSRALVCEDERAVTHAVEAVVETCSDGRAGGICAFAIREKLLG